MIFIASLSCWIIFTLPLAFMQPPATSCMVVRNSTVYLEAPNPKTRIAKRSISLEDFYHQNDEECLEIADNVVFERLRKDSKLDPLVAPRLHRNKGPPVKNAQKNYSLDNNRVRRDTEEVATTTEDSPVEDLKYKQLVFEENNPEAKTIDFETLQRKNRPADVLEYKRFLNVSFLPSLLRLSLSNSISRLHPFQNQPLDDDKPPKKAYANTKTRVKPPPVKVMVKRDIDDEANDENKSEFKAQQQWSTMRSLRKVSLLHEEEEEEEEELHRHAEVEQNVEVPVVRTKRYVRMHHSGQSPHTVVYAVNYDERENKGWVKPLFSSIVYRLPVQILLIPRTSSIPASSLPRTLANDRSVSGYSKDLLPAVTPGDCRRILLGACDNSSGLRGDHFARRGRG